MSQPIEGTLPLLLAPTNQWEVEDQAEVHQQGVAARTDGTEGTYPVEDELGRVDGECVD